MRKPKRKRNLVKLKPDKVDELVKLLEEWTRYEIAARLLPIHTNVCCDYYRRMLERENEIRTLLYGECDLIKLATVLGVGEAEDKLTMQESRHTAFVPDTDRDYQRKHKRTKLHSPKRHKHTNDIDTDIEQILREAGVL